jgi:hypothetical protein
MNMYTKLNRSNEFTASADDNGTPVTANDKLGEMTLKEKQTYHSALRNDKFIDITEVIPCKCAYLKSLGGSTLCTPCEMKLKREKTVRGRQVSKR